MSANSSVKLTSSLLLVMLTLLFPALATAMPTVGIGPFGPGTIDGSAPFNVLGGCSSSTDPQIQGEDCGENNGVVRTQDIVSHVWSITADNYAPGDPNLTNVTVEQTITPGTNAVIAFEKLPVACTPTGGGGTGAPVSGIVKNPDGSSVLTCNLGEFTEGQQKSLTVNVKISGDSWNGSDYSSTQRAYSLATNGTPNATEGTSVPVGPIQVSAVPAFDLVHSVTPTQGMYTDYIGTQDVGNGPELGFYNYAIIRLAAARKTGIESLQQSLVFKDNFVAYANSETGPVYPLEFYITECRDNPSGWAAEVFGSKSYYPSYDGGSFKYHASNSGTCQYTRDNPADPTSTAFTVTLDNADLSGTHYPTRTFGNTDLSAGPYYVISHRVQIWVPFRSIDMVDNILDNLGTVYLKSTLNDFDPNGVSGVSNFGASTEPGYNGADMNGLRGNNVIGAAMTLIPRGSFSKYNLKTVDDVATTYTPLMDGTYMWAHNGMTEREPGEAFASFVLYYNNGTLALNNPVSCDVFDQTTLKLTDRSKTGGVAGQYASIGSYAIGGFDRTHYQIEYAHLDLTGDDPLDINHDGTLDYDAGTGRYQGDWSKAETARCEDAAPAGGWHTDPNAVPGGMDTVNAARVRLTDAAKTAGIKFEPSHEIRFTISLEARDKFNGGPHDGQSIPVGTVLPNFAGVRSDEWSNTWTARNYKASPENGHVDGDRVTMSRLNIILDSESLTPLAASGNTASTLAGNPIVWKVDMALQSTQANPSSAENLRIIDVLPPTATYNATCTAEQADATPPSLIEYNTDKDGNPATGYTRLTWNFGDVVANTLIPARIFCSDTDPLAANGTAVVNYAEARADNIITALEVRSDDHTITLEQTGNIQISKKVDMPLDDMNDEQVYTISWANFAASFSINAPTLIDVFSFTSGTGDGSALDSGGAYISLSPRTPASDFHGQFVLTAAPSVTWLDGSVPTGSDAFAELGTWTYTADAPSSVSYDPDNNTSTWCLQADFGTSGCPSAFEQVTAIRFVSNYALAKDGDPRQGMKATYTMQAGDASDPFSADANLPGDLYTNRFTFDSTSLPAEQYLRSNNVSVQVAAFSIGDVVFADVNGNGQYDAGVDGVAPNGVKVELYSVSTGNKIKETTTGLLGPGRYLFEPLPSGEYYVRIPASEFQPGGKLVGWDIAPPTGKDKENDDLNETIDQHGYTESSVAGVGVRTGTITLSANPPPVGGVPSGNEPLGDNTLPIVDPTGDDFSNLTLDIGLQAPLSSLGNMVWVDSNNNGLQDVSELGLSNVTVNLLDAAGTVLQTTRTDNNGYYLFSALPAADYIIEVVKPVGYAFSPQNAGTDDTADSDTATTDGRSELISLAFGQHDTRWDAGLYPLGSIGDRLWIDSNANGLQDVSETTGLAAVTVNLLDTSGTVIGTAETDANGNYLFSTLPPANYTVDVDQTDPQLAGYNLTTANDPLAVTLAAGENYRAADFGYVNYASVGDTVWHDLNGNGLQESGEPGIAGVSVRLLDAAGAAILRTTTTDANGNYLFDSVIPGDYLIEVIKPAAYTHFVSNDQGSDDTVDSDVLAASGRTAMFSLSAGQHRTDLDAGLYQSATLGNLLWLDSDGNGQQAAEEPGLPGTQVTLTGTLGTGSAFTPVSVVTDANGFYQFANLYPGDYTVTFGTAGFVTADQGSDDALDSDVAPNGAAMVTLKSGDNNQTIDAGIAAASVTGRVWIDNNLQNALDNGMAAEQGVIGVTAKLIDAATGQTVATTTTGADGVYNFTGVKPGNYLVEIIEPANMGFVAQDQGSDDSIDSDVNSATGRSEPFALNAGQHVTDIDAGIEPGALGDHVTLDLNNNGIQDAGEPGVAGIQVHLLNSAGTEVSTQTTDATGFYNFTGVAPGNYTVAFELPANMSFAQQDQGSNDTLDFDTDTEGKVSVTVVSGVGNQTVDAGIIPATLGDTVWFDANRDGLQTAGEPGIAAIPVLLLDDNGNPVLDTGGNPISTTTDADGHYQFTVLPGSYRVQFKVAPELGFTTALAGTNPAMDSDANSGANVDGITAPVTLQSGDHEMTLDAGIAPAVISGQVLLDQNGNGVQESGDQPVAGVLITLRGTDILGNPLEQTTTTDVGGQYSFAVMPGTYTVTETNPADRVSSGAEPGNLGSTVLNDDSIRVTLNSGESSQENDFLDYQPASLSGQVREDTDGDGDLADSDAGIPGVEVILWLDNNGNGTADVVYANTTTNGLGEYNFTHLPPAHYVVVETDPVTHSSTADTQGGNDNRIALALASGETSPGHDFLDTRPASIAGQVRLDDDRDGDLSDTEKGIAGLTITLYTDPNGDGDPSDGSVLTSTTTNAQGTYRFDQVLPGTYVVVETDGPDMQSTGDSAGGNDNRVPVTLLADTDSTGNDFLDTSVLGSLSGVVWADSNSNGSRDLATEAGIPGVSVRILGVAGNLIATLTTDLNGAYQLDHLPAGNYRVEVLPSTLPAGTLQTGDPDSQLDHQTLATVTAGNNTAGLDFGYVTAGSIGDQVWHDLNANGIQDEGEPGIANVAVKLLDSNDAIMATTTTDANGNYQFGGLSQGDYSVQFIKPDSFNRFSPALQGSDTLLDSETINPANGQTTAISLSAGQNRTDIDTGLFRTASLGDTVWFDTNGNGLQDTDEPGIASISITLNGTPADGSSFAQQTTLTDAAGNYLFSALIPGTYTARFTPPTGMTFTAQDQGSDNALDSDVAADGSASITLASGETQLTLDAGVLPADISGRVWIDNNTSNGLDEGADHENGVVGVNVNLIDVATGNAILTTTTGADGLYHFTGVMPGEYVVEIVEPAHMGFVSQNVGSDDRIDSDVDLQTGRSPAFIVASGQSVTDMDAGIEPGQLGDRVWLDKNNNGLQDSGEPGVAAITVNLVNANGQVVDTQITDASGFYNFTGVLPANYSVQFVLPSTMRLAEQDRGTDDSLDSDADAISGEVTVTVVSGVGNQTIDAGIIPATLGDTVWFDANDNGLQDEGELPLAGVQLALLDAAGNPLQDAGNNRVTTITDANGKYQFIVLPGSYGIQVLLTEGASLTLLDAGDDTLDSDTAPASGKSAAVAVASGDAITHLDAGIKRATLSGSVIIDQNANGVEDSADTDRLPGTVITVSGTDLFGNPVSVSTTTDTDGNYSVSVPPGLYTVAETTPTGYTSTGAEPGTLGSTVVDADTLTITIGSGQVSEHNDFLERAAASLSGQVREDVNGDADLADATDAGIPGVEIFLWADSNADGAPDTVVASTLTDSSGHYTFSDLAPGAYVVVENDLAGFVSTADTAADNDNRIAVSLLSGEHSPGHDYLDTRMTNISGQVRNDTDRDGDFTDTEAGLAGVTIRLYTDPNGDGNPDDGVLVATETSDAQGHYLFSNIVPGSYVVVEHDPQGYESTADTQGVNDNRIPLVLASGQDSTGNDLLDTQQQGALSGTVWNDALPDGTQATGEIGIPGVTVLVKDALGTTVATLTTDENGFYQANNLPVGSYTVLVQSTTLPAGSIQTGDPDDALNHKTTASVLPGGHTADLDFGYVVSAKIGDTVWEDLNANGVQDEGEPGIAGVTVTLSSNGDTLQTVATDANGHYLFNNLIPADYMVTFGIPTGYLLTTAHSGNDDALDSDPAGDGKVAVTLASADKLTMDAGLYRLGALGDTVWLDANNNGVQDSGETMISGISVKLLDTTGAALLDTSGQPLVTSTDAAGHYAFTDLKPGDYQVAFVAPAGVSFTSADQGSDDLKDSDAQANGLAPATVISGQTNRSVDAGITPAAVTGRVWIDNNTQNGTDDGQVAEHGVIGVTVNLIDSSSGLVVATTTTGANGVYTFTGVEPGDYLIEVIEPANMGFVAQNQGSDDTLDSDVALNNGRTPVFTLTSGAAVTDMDAGIEPGALGDHVFLDLNNNGLQDSGEPGVAAVTVNLLDASGNPVATQTTDNTGFYNFAANLPGDYTLEFILPAGMSFTTANVGGDDTLDSDAAVNTGRATVTVISGVGNQTLDAGVVPATIGDTVWLDLDADGTQGAQEPVLPNLVVTLLDSAGQPVLDQGGNPVTTMTDSQGQYRFTVLPGSYGVSFHALEGSQFTAMNNGSNDAADSDADLLTGSTATVSVASGEHNTSLDAGILPAKLSGKVLLDTNGDGARNSSDTPLTGVTVRISGTDVFGNPVNITRTTDADGNYSVLLAPGLYTVTETNPTGYTSSAAEPGTVGSTLVNRDMLNVALNSGDDSSHNDFLDYQLASLSGQVRDDANGDGDLTQAGETGMGGVSVILWRDEDGDGTADTVYANQTTDSEGAYSFTGLPPGHYIVLETDLANYLSTADSDAENDNRIAVVLASAEHSVNHVFLDMKPRSALGDRVWHDLNANGVQDEGEMGIAGVTVLLYADSDQDGQPDAGLLMNMMSTLTDRDGHYLFSGLPAGGYLVRVALPTGYDRFSAMDAGGNDEADSDVNADGLSATVTLSADQNNLSVDAGLYRLATLGNTVWLDKNGNALQNNGEPGIGGITVNLQGTAGTGQTVSLTTTTDQNGYYQFTQQVPGTYNVQWPLPASIQLVSADQGGNDELDSDPATASHSVLETLTSGENNQTLDAGVVAATLSGALWEDRNGDDLEGEGEATLSGVSVMLYTDPNGDGNPEDGELIATTATNANGEYLFNGLLPAGYIVQVTPPADYRAVTPNQGTDDTVDSDLGSNGQMAVQLGSGATRHLDAGYERKGSFGDRVWLDLDANGLQDADEPSMREVTLALLDKDGQAVLLDSGEAYQVMTDAQGAYRFDGLWPGAYQVQILTLEGFTPTQTDAGSDDALDNDANANGQMPAFVYSGEHNPTVDAGILPASVNGRVWFDNKTHNGIDDNMYTEPGAVGIVVNLLDENGKIAATTTTGVDGLYSFSGILPGNYQLGFVTPDNMKLVLADQGGDDAQDSDADPATGLTPVFTLTSTQAAKDLDAGIEPGALGDRVWVDNNQNGVQDTGETGVPGVTVILTDSTGKAVQTETDANGFYVFNDLIPGHYTVGFDLPEGMTFIAPNQGSNDSIDSDADPVSGTVAVSITSGATGDQTVDAGVQPALIGDRVWLDANNNGLQDEGEAGIANVSVVLTDANGQTVQSLQTDAAGNYLFSVMPGQYAVSAVPVDSSFVASHQGSDDQLDSDVNAQGATPVMSFASGTDDRSIDIGIVPAQLSGMVLEDLTLNGKDATDQPLSGVLITVSGTDSYGNPVTMIIQTDEKGEYRVSLPPGSYTVTETDPADFLSHDSTPANLPASTVIDLNQVAVTLLSGEQASGIVFLDYQFAKVSGSVLLDPEGDGDTAGDGTPVARATVLLYTDPNGDGNPDDGTLIDSVITDETGRYSFDALEPGSYVLLETDPAGHLSTADSSGENDNHIPLTLVSGETRADTVFLDTLPVTLSGSVRDDANLNGTLDATDPGLAGVAIELYTDPNGDGNPNDGVLVSTASTSADGGFSFVGVLPGHYVVVETDPLGFDSLFDSQAPNDNHIPVTLVAGNKPLALVFMDVRPVGDLTGQVLQDTDGDGDLNDPDTGISSVTVSLWTDPNQDGDPSDGKVVTSVVTDSTGHYVIEDVPAGSYVLVQQNKPGYLSTADVGGGNDDRIPVLIEVVDGKHTCRAAGQTGCTGLYFLDRLLKGELDLLKTAYPGHDGGARCGTTAAKAVQTLVDINKDLAEAVTYCFELTNTGEAWLGNIQLKDDTLGIGMAEMKPLTALPARLAPLSKDSSARIRYYHESVVTESLVNTASASASMMLADGTPLGELSASDTSSVTVNFVFDPPTAIKTVKATGEAAMLWQMVWINSSSNAVAGVAVFDEVPVGTLYSAMAAGAFVSPDGVYCEARGSSVTAVCQYESPSSAYPRGRVLWQGDIGPDLGHTTETAAANEVVIRFYSTLDDKAKVQTIENRAHSSWDLDKDGKPELTDITTDNGATKEPGDSTSITFGDNTSRLQIPTLGEWMLLLLGLLMLMMGMSYLRQRQ